MARRILVTSLVLGLAVASASVVAAQERVPTAGTTAVGFDFGAYVPKDNQLDNSVILSGLFEYYVTPRVSLRSDFGWANPQFKNPAIDSLRQIPLRLDINYNWEGGRWHPFVGSGVGAYFLQFKREGDAFGDSETKLGMNVGAGLEYFTGRTVALKGEARYHIVPNVRGGQDPSGLAVTMGLKKYF
jgi:hypothetical protein